MSTQEVLHSQSVGEWYGGTRYRGYLGLKRGDVSVEWGRADKKAQVAPHVPRWQIELVHDIGRFLRITSDGEAGRRLVLAAANDIPSINKMSRYFWRDYARGSHTWIGHNDHADLDELVSWPHDQTERLKMRFVRDEWRELDELAFALASPVAHAAGALLTFALRDERVVQKVAPGFVSRSAFTTRKGFYQWAGGQKLSSRYRR